MATRILRKVTPKETPKPAEILSQEEVLRRIRMLGLAGEFARKVATNLENLGDMLYQAQDRGMPHDNPEYAYLHNTVQGVGTLLSGFAQDVDKLGEDLIELGKAADALKQEGGKR